MGATRRAIRDWYYWHPFYRLRPRHVEHFVAVVYRFWVERGDTLLVAVEMAWAAVWLWVWLGREWED